MWFILLNKKLAVQENISAGQCSLPQDSAPYHTIKSVIQFPDNENVDWNIDTTVLQSLHQNPIEKWWNIIGEKALAFSDKCWRLVAKNWRRYK